MLRRNNTSFPVRAAALLRETYAGPAQALKYYQALTREVMTNPEFGLGEDYRGLLVYYTMGMGKTILAVSVALALADRRPLLVAPRSLHANFRGSIDKYLRLLHPDWEPARVASEGAKEARRFRMVSSDAHNMASQVMRASDSTLDNSLVIVDEAHNFFRAVINSPDDSTNARRLYNLIMRARNIRLLFLSGTPSAKDPFELVPCFNMLTGGELLPVRYETFYRYFVDTASNTVRNRDKLANRLTGLVSHVRHSLSERDREGGGFPTVLEQRVTRVEMAAEQYRRYLEAREKEESKGRGGVGAPGALSLPGAERDTGSTYYVESRMMGNHGRPATKDDRPGGAAGSDPSSDEGPVPPKLLQALEDIRASPGPVVVYSQFVRTLDALAAVLREAGFAQYSPAPKKRGGDLIAADKWVLRHCLKRLDYTPTELRQVRKMIDSNPQKYHGPWYSAKPAIPYRERPGPRLYGVHRGQRKLFVSELQLLTRYANQEDKLTLVYVGAAPGSHIVLLARIWANIQFELYDSARYDPRLQKLPNVKLHNSYFTDETARSWKGRCDLFVSDIRVPPTGGAVGTAFEGQVDRDLRDQANWVRTIRPTIVSMLKFRLPYTEHEPYSYLRGRIMLQAWAPRESTETRLVVEPGDAAAADMEYEPQPYQDALAYHNVVRRPWARYDDGHDYDFTHEAKAWEAFLSRGSASHLLKQGNRKASVADCMELLTASIGQPPPPRRSEAQRCLEVRGGAPALPPHPRYAAITGEVPPETRDQIQRVWNSHENMHGAKIFVLLISKTGAEGLDLKYGRTVIKMEPYWDKAREHQVDARTARLGSHDDLPEAERTVQPILYLAVPNSEVYEEIPEAHRERQTIDEQFHLRAQAKYELNEAFRQLLRDVAVECSIYNPDGSCHLCLPTDQSLFLADLERDLRFENPCQPLVSSEIEAESLELGGVTYYYTPDPSSVLGYRFYVYEPSLEINREIQPNEAVFDQLMEAVHK